MARRGLPGAHLPRVPLVHHNEATLVDCLRPVNPPTATILDMVPLVFVFNRKR